MPAFGEFTYGSSLYGGGASSITVYPEDVLIFDGFSLSDGVSMIMETCQISGPERDIEGGNIPRQHGKYVSSDLFREYIIEARGIIKKDTAAELDAYLDTLKKNLRALEGDLDYTDANGTVRRFRATLSNFDSLLAGREHYHITHHPWQARFVCYEPFGLSRSYNSALTSVTSSPETEVVTHDGTKEAKTVFVVVASSATGVTGGITIASDTTGESVQYADTISAGDVLEFDGENMTVKLNGTEVDYAGSFPHLEPDDNSLRFTVPAGTFSLSITTKWKTTYL